MFVWKKTGDVGLSLPLWGVLDLAGMLRGEAWRAMPGSVGLPGHSRAGP